MNRFFLPVAALAVFAVACSKPSETTDSKPSGEPPAVEQKLTLTYFQIPN